MTDKPTGGLGASSPRQGFKGVVCPLPSRIEVAAIKRDQRARGFEDRVRLIPHRLTAGVRKSRCQPADSVELADEHGGRRRGGLADLIECKLGKALKPHRRHPYPESATIVVPVPFEWGTLGQREQRVSEPVDAGNAGERVVYRGRQSADRDLNDLGNAELTILGERAVTTDVNSASNRCFERADLVRWDDCCERFAAEHELGRAA